MVLEHANQSSQFPGGCQMGICIDSSSAMEGGGSQQHNFGCGGHANSSSTIMSRISVHHLLLFLQLSVTWAFHNMSINLEIPFLYFDTPEQEDPNSPSKLALQSDAKSHFCSNKNYSSDERSYKTPCNNFSETEHIFLLKRKLLSDFDNSDMRHPSIPFERNRDLSHEHLRQSAARPAGGVSVTSGNTGSAISSKTRIRWTQDLHDHFVECVNHLGGAESNTEGNTEVNGLRAVDHLSCEKPFAKISNCKVHARFCRSGKSERKNNMNDAAQIDIKAKVLANMKRVSDLNNLNSKVMGLTWGMWDATIFSIHQKVILGADVLYDTSGFDDLLATVTFLLQNSPGSVFITTYHSRSGHHLIEFLMAKWVLKCTKLLDGFLCMPSYKASGMAEIVLNSEEVR
ncbi:unnamed protein product [Camellia sinensis]